MKDTTLSKKVGEKYEPMITLKQGKYGMQFALTPQFQKELYAWVKSQDGTYFNMNVKVWDDKPEAKSSASDVYNDELPPF